MSSNSKTAPGAAYSGVGCSIKLMASPLGHGLAPAANPAVGHGQLQELTAHAKAAVPTASEAVLEHLKQGDCATAITDITLIDFF